MKIQNITIVGAGALGILYGQYFMEKLGQEHVTFAVDAERKARYGSAAFTCNGAPFTPRFVSAEEAEVSDLVLFAVKYTGLEKAMEDAAPLIGPDTVLLSVLNGVTSERALEARFGGQNVVYCVAQGMDATKSGYALTYRHIGQLRVGIPVDHPEKRPALDALTALFDTTALPYVREEDILHRLWSKLMLNVGVNQVVMVYEGTYATVQAEGEAREKMIAAMHEVTLVAKREGITLTEEDLFGYVRLIDTLDPNGMPSMRQDGLAKRKSEVDLFAGTICRMADEAGIDVPVNRELLATIRAMEARY